MRLMEGVAWVRRRRKRPDIDVRKGGIEGDAQGRTEGRTTMAIGTGGHGSKHPRHADGLGRTGHGGGRAGGRRRADRDRLDVGGRWRGGSGSRPTKAQAVSRLVLGGVGQAAGRGQRARTSKVPSTAHNREAPADGRRQRTQRASRDDGRRTAIVNAAGLGWLAGSLPGWLAGRFHSAPCVRSEKGAQGGGEHLGTQPHCLGAHPALLLRPCPAHVRHSGRPVRLEALEQCRRVLSA